MPAKRKSKTTGAPPAKRSKSKKWIGTKFGQLLDQAGLILEEEHKLRVDPAVFKRELAISLKRTGTLSSNVEEFIQGLRDYLDNPTRLKASIMPTGIMEGEDIRARFGGLDSLMRLLMGVDALQTLVIDVLLEWMAEYMSSEGEEMDGMELCDFLLMPKLMLSQFRMLDHLVNGKDLCDKLLELVEIAPLEMKREIVVALPEILDDPQHNSAAQKLKLLLETSSGLTAATLDALSNLNMANEIGADVLDTALDSLRSVDIDDLPTVIKYVNESVTLRNSKEVIAEMREKLCLDFNPVPIISSTPLTQPKQSSKTSGYFIVLDTIRSSICFQRPVADGWIKAITSVSSPESHLVIDVFVLFVLHSITAHKKTVEKIFINKVKAGCFSDDLMNSVFSSHPGALKNFFPSLLQLSEVLLCSSSPSVSGFAVSFYKHLFTSFEDVFSQQKVVDALVTLINNGMRSEVDHALDILLLLLEHHCRVILRFTPLIKTMLDYLDHMTILQIRKLYQVLGILAFSDLDDGTAMQSELHMIIRKQLTHFEPRYRHFGVVGSVMTIQQIARNSSDSMMSQTLSQSSRKQDMAKTMLDEVMMTCSHSKECSILFCDEMCAVVPKLDNSILEYLCQQVTTNFQDTFLVEVTDGVPDNSGIPLEFLYGLDSTDEGSIGLNLLPMVISKDGDGGEGLVAMAAQFRLLRTCEHHMNMSLESIDALLGCPVLMCPENLFEGETFNELHGEKRSSICLSIFYCINWFRELVCAFVGEDDIEMKGKVIIRLHNITELQNRLETCMTGTPGFWPPSVSTLEEPTPAQIKGKSTKNDITLVSMTAATQHIEKDASAIDKTITPAVPIDKLRPYFRELTLSVFKVFHFDSLSRTILDSELNTKEQQDLQLQTSQILFLLQDLANKLTTTFATTTFGHKVPKSDSNVSYTSADLVETMTRMMPALCEQLENTSAYFQAQLADNDGVMDMGSDEATYPQLCLCFHLLLKILSLFFGWPSLSDPHYSEDLKKSLSSILSRINTASSQHPSSLHQMAYEACRYIERFSDFLPTLTCAHVLAKVLVAISKTCRADDLHPIISRACGCLLQRPWKTNETTQMKNTVLSFLLKYHIEWSKDALSVVETLVTDATVELMGEEATEHSSKYPTLSSSSFACFYRVMMGAMVTNLKGISMDDESIDDSFYTLQVSTKVFSMLVNLVSSFSKNSVLSSVLKIGRLYIEAFLKCGMTILNIMFRSKKEEVLQVLKTLQQSTRVLQHCCSHSKVKKDSNLINHVPSLKKNLETLIYRVKELMMNHNCQDAFVVGTLKNRDLKGQEILSQVPPEEDEEEEDDLASGTNSTDTKSMEDEIQEINSDFSED